MVSQKLHIRNGDRVLVLSGKDKGKKGKVISAQPKENRVKVEGINIIKKHAKPTRKVPQGGIREMEAAVHASNLMLICPSCQQATRVKHTQAAGKKVRGCKKCGENLDK